MPKTQAEIQRAYRERKKAKDKYYLKKESERVGKYYKPSAELNGKELEERREKNRENQRRCRAKKNEPEENEKYPKLLKVKINFDRAATKRRKLMKEKNDKIRSLQERIASLEKTNKTLRKRSERNTKKNEGASSRASHATPPMPDMTPRSRASAQIEESGMRVNQVSEKLVKRLVFTNVLVDEIKDSVNANKKTAGARIIRNVISGRVAKKYGMVRHMSRETGLSRKHLLNTRSKLVSCQKKYRLFTARKLLEKTVVSFLERDDNSRMMPGKNDTKTCESGQKLQKRILSDYLYNLRLKYLAENPKTKISQAAFYRMRPKYMQPVSFASRDTCLCQIHQNMALLLRPLRGRKIITNGNPDTFIKEKDDEEVKRTLESIPDDVISYDQWKRVEEEGKQRMKIVSENCTKAQFKLKVTESVKKFRAHVDRHHEQYRQLRSLKANLPASHMILQMDFAENYTCQSAQEVQSAFWNGPTMVSLHPVVAYYKIPGNSELQHKSFVLVSGELSHDATAVYTILKVLFPYLKELLPEITHVHYWTDSPTSQYRNKSIFAIVANHTREFDGVSATWNYFEAGHGKGPCDGVGGSAKRMADEAVISGKCIIDDADGFFKWANDHASTTTSVSYLFYDKDDYKRAAANLQKYDTLQTVPGTMKLHAVTANVPHQVIHRVTSCYCQECLANPFATKCDWISAVLCRPSSTTVQNQLSLKIGDFVATVYDKKWYIGKVEEVDESDGEALITYMTRGGKSPKTYSFWWPTKADELWVTRKDVLCVIEPPTQRNTKTRKSYTLSSATLELIQERFGLHKD